MTLVQRSLFPEAFEIQDAALAALDGMEIRRGLALTAEARERDPELVGLGKLQRGLSWLAGIVDEREPAADGVARAWRELPGARRFGLLPADSAAFLDEALARQARRIEGAPGSFLDAAQTVHRGALRLALGNSLVARDLLLETLTSGHRDRADLWGYLADACLLEERGEDANACYVRALVISARDVDFFRIRDPRLARLCEDLLGAHPEDVAREIVLPHAWLAGVVSIPAGNDWIPADLLGALLETPDRGPAADERRYARLLYRDRSMPPGEYSEEAREEMRSLAPDLFRRFVQECGKRERAGTPLLRW